MRCPLLLWILTVTATLTAAAAHADTRYYLIETDYRWEMFATQDDATYGEPGEVAEEPIPIRGCDPLNLRLLMKVEDADLPGRKARVTLWFERIGYADDLRDWTLSGFEDPTTLRQRARGFLAQPRRLVAIPDTLAYEEEALGLLISLAHGRPLLIDLDVPPDTPDPLIYQADALIASVLTDTPPEPIAERHGVAWLESDAAVQDLADRVLSSDVQRVERLRQLLWHHLKALAFFAENHQWAYLNPAALDADAPLIRVPLNDADGSSRLTVRPADLSSTTPAFGFPALYRWASLTDQDLAVAVSQSRWDATPTGRANSGNATPADPRTRSHAQRLDATRASLAGARPVPHHRARRRPQPPPRPPGRARPTLPRHPRLRPPALPTQRQPRRRPRRRP